MNAKLFFSLIGMAVATATPNLTHAKLLSLANSSIAEIRITSDVGATFLWLDNWYGMTEANAFDSSSGLAMAIEDETGNNFSLTSTGFTTQATALSTVSLTDGDALGLSQNSLQISVESAFDLVLSDTFALSESFAMTSNRLVMFDLASGSTANVDIQIDYTYSLSSNLSDGATYDVMLSTGMFLMDLDDQPSDADSVDATLIDSFNLMSSSELDQLGMGTLSISALLQSEKEYAFAATTSLAAFGMSGTFDDIVTVPAPGSAWLAMIGLAFVGRIRRSAG